MLRGAAIGWSVLSARAWSVYMAALLLDYTYCISSTMVQRRIKDIPRRELVWDIAGICAGAPHACHAASRWAAGMRAAHRSMRPCAGYTLPMLLASLGEVLRGELGQATALWAGVATCLGVSSWVCSQHIPEKWYPGTFDIVHSHAIMHVLVTVEYCLEWIFIRNSIIEDGLKQSVY